MKAGKERIKIWSGEIERDHGHSSSLIPQDRKEKSRKPLAERHRMTEFYWTIRSSYRFQTIRNRGLSRENSTGGKYSLFRTTVEGSVMSFRDILKYSHTSLYSTQLYSKDRSFREIANISAPCDMSSELPRE